MPGLRKRGGGARCKPPPPHITNGLGCQSRISWQGRGCKGYQARASILEGTAPRCDTSAAGSSRDPPGTPSQSSLHELRPGRPHWLRGKTVLEPKNLKCIDVKKAGQPMAPVGLRAPRQELSSQETCLRRPPAVRPGSRQCPPDLRPRARAKKPSG